MVRVLRCSASIQMEVLDRIVEIAAREKRDKIDVLRDPALRSFLSTSHQNHRQKPRIIVKCLPDAVSQGCMHVWIGSRRL